VEQNSEQVNKKNQPTNQPTLNNFIDTTIDVPQRSQATLPLLLHLMLPLKPLTHSILSYRSSVLIVPTSYPCRQTCFFATTVHFFASFGIFPPGWLIPRCRLFAVISPFSPAFCLSTIASPLSFSCQLQWQILYCASPRSSSPSSLT